MSANEREEDGIGESAGSEATRGSRESALPSRFALPAAVGWVGAWLALFALALGMQRLSPVWLGVAAVATLAWGFSREVRAAWWAAGAAVVLAIATAFALGLQLRLGEIARDWPAVRAEIEEDAAIALGASLDDLVDRGSRAVAGTAQVTAGVATGVGRAAAFEQLEDVRRRTGMSAVALYAVDGDPLAWAGEHRGLIPQSVLDGAREYVFHRGPLFAYLYFVQPLEDGRIAVAATLLASSVPTADRPAPFAERFSRRHGVEPRFMAPDRVEGGTVWDWATDQPILSVTFGPLPQDAWHARVAGQGRRTVAAAWAVALLLLGFGWYRSGAGPAGVPIVVGTVSLLVLPLGVLLGADGLFSPLQFVLAGPRDATLGQLLILLGGASLWALTRPPPSRALRRLPLAARVTLAALLIPLALELVRRSASAGLLAAELAGGLPLIAAATLLIALPLHVLLREPGSEEHGRRRPFAPAMLAAALALALAFALALSWHPDRVVPVWATALWGAPFALFLLALRRAPRRPAVLAAWAVAGWLGGTAATAYFWTAHLEARLDAAEAELASLGTEADPFLDFLLRQFAERTLFLAAEGEAGVDLLYRGWVGSGLAREGYEARITTWAAGVPEAELRLSDLELPPGFVRAMLERARAAEEPLLERYTQQESLHYLLIVPLPGERVVSVATPPRRRLDRATPLARFLHPDEPGPLADATETLTLIPLTGEEVEMHGPGTPGQVEWARTPSGWRSEATVQFPTGPIHAHLVLRTAPTWLLLVRGVLAQVFVLALLVLLWSLARTLCGEPLGLSAARWQTTRTFRGRLTVALFGFFLVPTLIFGAVAYQALTREVVRTAAALARHSLGLAAPAVAAEPLPALGARVQSDLLLYRGGALVGASAPEVLELGLFQTWLPPGVELRFATGEDLEALQQRRLAGNRYLIAYRRVADEVVLAAPIPLAAGEIARRQRELADALLAMTLLGAAFSIVLALLVGRALSRPIELLSRAAASVGAGNLRLRLPEDRPDEFGGVYRAFNRMVRGLRRARSAEVRTARVLAWGEMARQVAHEIKNPLTPIKLSVQHLRRAHLDRRADFAEVLNRNVDAILREIDRLGEIARAFARFGTPQAGAGTLESIDLHQAVAETLVLYRGGADGIEYRTELDPALPRVLARDGELKEVLLNLLENARDALDGSGEIRISARPAGGGEWVRIAVHDTGSGIPAELLSRIFEPQFSTRTSGTGLGLAIVRRLVESWGGEVTVESAPGEGTTIHLRLRAEDGRGTRAPRDDRETAPLG